MLITTKKKLYPREKNCGAYNRHERDQVLDALQA